MKKKIRELTDRKRGISNEVREKKYQEYVRGWVELLQACRYERDFSEKQMNGQGGESERSIGNNGRKSKRNTEC